MVKEAVLIFVPIDILLHPLHLMDLTKSILLVTVQFFLVLSISRVSSLPRIPLLQHGVDWLSWPPLLLILLIQLLHQVLGQIEWVGALGTFSERV